MEVGNSFCGGCFVYTIQMILSKFYYEKAKKLKEQDKEGLNPYGLWRYLIRERLLGAQHRETEKIRQDMLKLAKRLQGKLDCPAAS